MVAGLYPCLGDHVEFLCHGLRMSDPEFNLPAFPIYVGLCLFLRSLGRPLLPDVKNFLHADTDLPLLTVRAALAREQLGFWRASDLPVFETLRMDTYRQPCVL